MADAALGVVGIVGVALDVSLTTYTFISSVHGAPQEIETLAGHINNLKLFLEPFHLLVSKPVIFARAQNVDFIPAVRATVSGLEGVLKGLADEVKQYIKYKPGSQIPSWAGWGSVRRVKYAFNRSSLLELEASLLGRMEALHLTLAPMDLSWTLDLGAEDSGTVSTLRHRASGLETLTSRRRIASGGLRSTTSISSTLSWASIYEDAVNDTETITPPDALDNLNDGDGIPVTDDSESNRHSEAMTTLGDYHQSDDWLSSDNPFVLRITLRAGRTIYPAFATVDAGSRVNLVSRDLVDGLQLPIKYFTTPPPSLLQSTGGTVMPVGTVTLVMKDEANGRVRSTKSQFYVLPRDNETYHATSDVVLGVKWILQHRTFANLQSSFTSGEPSSL